MQILELNVYNFGTWVEICLTWVYDKKKKGVVLL